MDPRPEYDELKDAPFLRSIPKVDPFEVPDGFFDLFPALVQSRITERAGSNVRSAWRTHPLLLRLAGATAVIGALVLAFVLFRPSVQEDPAIAETAVILTTDDLLLHRGEMSDLVRSMDDPADLMAVVGSGLDTDEMALYLEREELPLDFLIDEL